MGHATESEIRRSTRELAEGDVLAGKYRIERMLGEGGMGAVYGAVHLLTKKRVAIKAMHPRYAADEEWVARFVREAQAAGRVHHPNVVDVYDVDRDGATPFLVMELLRGTPLSALLEQKGRLAPELAIDLLMPALRGIAAAHAEGIVHRDLKPDNVFLLHDASDHVIGAKVLDFGISKAREDELSSLTKTGTVMGTPHYMSLEQIRGRRDVDARTDVYSVGVILYRALSGELPFDADTFPALAVEIATAELVPLQAHLPDIDPALAEVVARGMERDRDRRLPDITTLALALEPFGTVRFEEHARSIRVSPPKPARSSVESAPTLARTPSEPAPEPPVTGERKIAVESSPQDRPAARPSRAPLWIGLGVVGLAAFGIATWIALRGASEPSLPASRAPQPAPAPTPEPPVAPAPERVEPVVPVASDPPVEPSPRVVEERPSRRRRAGRPETSAHDRPPEPREPGRTASGVRTGGVSVEDF